MGEVFVKAYPKIKHSAYLITRRVGRNPKELINQTFIELNEKEYPVNPDEFVKWFTKAMHLRSMPKSKFHEQTTYRTFDTNLIQECDTDIVKLEYEPDFIPEHLPSELVGKYISLVSFKKCLPLHERYIFELYYEGGNSGHEIARLLKADGYNMNRHNVNKNINSIKRKLAEWKKL